METSVENRLVTLEEQVRQILRIVQSTSPDKLNEKNWRQSLGMLTGRANMKQIDEAGQNIRQRDREASSE